VSGRCPYGRICCRMSQTPVSKVPVKMLDWR
jgi:hypothetical protein